MKGHTNNPNGRPKGKPNKITQDMRQWIAQIIDSNREQMVQDLQTLEPIERLKILERLFPYVVPKQQAVSADVDFSTLTDGQIDTIVDNLTKTIGDEN